MSEESSTSKRRIGGIFPKKTEKRDGEESAPEKKKKHKREPSVVSTKASRLEDREDLSEPDGASSPVVKPLKEKEKHKTSLRRFSFRKAKPLKKKKHLAEDTEGILLDDPAPNSNEGEQSAGQGKEEPVENDEEIVDQDGNEPADEDKESWVVLTADVPEDFIPKFPSETKEMESSILDTACPVEDDSPVKAIIPKPAGLPEHLKGQEKSIFPSTAILWGAFTHLKQLVIRNDKLADVDTVTSSSRYEIGLYVYDASLAKLVALWSFLLTPVTRASQTSKQILVYWVSSLIKKYPQCFKVYLKEKKQRREKAAPKEIAAPKQVKINED